MIKSQVNLSFFYFFYFYRDIDKVDATMDDIRDQMDVANEISEAISRPVNVGDELDEVNHYWLLFLEYYILTISCRMIC